MAQFDPLTTTATGLQRLLSTNALTSVQIVTQYLAQIDKYEPKLNALISRAPREKVLAVAASLDEERKNGRIRSPLHGIPIILKDCFTTKSSMGMTTTCGSLALVGSKASKNATMVQKMIDAGLIILAKANMTEFCGMKMTYMMPGWSAHGGQTLSPYVPVIEPDEKILGHSAPGGSSTGSAVSLSAGFAPLAMGTETIGSIITPTSRNYLYGLKPTIGVQDTTGLYTMTDFYDSPGPMAKSAADVAALASLLLDRDFEVPGDWSGFSVGVVDPRKWTLSENMCLQHDGTGEDMVSQYEDMVKTLEAAGCKLKYPVVLDDKDKIPPMGNLAHWEFTNIGIPKFVKFLDYCPVSSAADIVKFNEDNKEKAMPEPYTEQNDLIMASERTEDASEFVQSRIDIRTKAREVIDGVLKSEGVDLLVGTCDSAFVVPAASAGYPVMAMPLGRLKYNGRPFGICVMAKAGAEDVMLRFMAAYERAIGPRVVPDMDRL